MYFSQICVTDLNMSKIYEEPFFPSCKTPDVQISIETTEFDWISRGQQ